MIILFIGMGTLIFLALFSAGCCVQFFYRYKAYLDGMFFGVISVIYWIMFFLLYKFYKEVFISEVFRWLQ